MNKFERIYIPAAIATTLFIFVYSLILPKNIWKEIFLALTYISLAITIVFGTKDIADDIKNNKRKKT